MNWLENGELLASIGEFLVEDIGRGDITTSATVPTDTRGIGKFLAKEYLVLFSSNDVRVGFAYNTG